MQFTNENQCRLSIKLVIILLFLPMLSFSQQKIYNGFVGGMFLHTGFVDIPIEYYPDKAIYGNFYGLGGKIAFNFTDYLRIGSEGYSSGCEYDHAGSYIDIGWGGILFEGGYKIQNIRPFAGITLGGGNVKNLLIVNGSKTDNQIDNVIYRHYNIFVYIPYAGFEYHFKKKLCFTLKADWLHTPKPQIEGNKHTGARIYLGILFRKKPS